MRVPSLLSIFAVLTAVSASPVLKRGGGNCDRDVDDYDHCHRSDYDACDWPGHCWGTSCSDSDDCWGELTCVCGRCRLESCDGDDHHGGDDDDDRDDWDRGDGYHD